MSMLVQVRRHLARNVVGYLALFVALGGTSYAAVKLGKNAVKANNLAPNSVTSSKVKNGKLLAKDFKAGQLPKGAKGDPGATGATGAPGGLSDTVETIGNVLTLTGTADIISLVLPAGSWLVFSHVGSAYNGTAGPARLECTINEPGNSGTDFAKLRFPPTDPANSLGFGDMTLHAAVSFAAPTAVKTTCSVVESTGSFTLTTRKMTAVRIGRVTAQTP